MEVTHRSWPFLPRRHSAICLLQGLEEEAAGDLLPTFLSGGQRAAPSWHPPGQGAALTPPALPKCSSHGAGGTDGAAQHPGCSHRLMAQHQCSFPRGMVCSCLPGRREFRGKEKEHADRDDVRQPCVTRLTQSASSKRSLRDLLLGSVQHSFL